MGGFRGDVQDDDEMEESQPPPPPAQPDFAVFADDDAPAALPSPQTDRNFEIFSDESSSKPEAAAPASARRPLGAKLIDVDTPMAAVRKPTIGLTPLRPGLTPLAPAAGPAGAPIGGNVMGDTPRPARAPLQGFTPRPAPKLNGAGGGATIAAVASTASALAPIQPPALCHQESSAEKLPSPTINTKAALMDLMGGFRGGGSSDDPLDFDSVADAPEDEPLPPAPPAPPLASFDIFDDSASSADAPTKGGGGVGGGAFAIFDESSGGAIEDEEPPPPPPPPPGYNPRPSMIENAPPPPPPAASVRPRPSQIENAPPPVVTTAQPKRGLGLAMAPPAPRAPPAVQPPTLPGVTIYESAMPANASIFPGGDEDDDVTCRGLIRLKTSDAEGGEQPAASKPKGGFSIFAD